MKRFSDFITEEVVPAALVQNGSIDIDKEEVRASINMALAKVTADGVVTPYIALNRIQKALAYFHIILPKKVYLDGAKGVEVHELRQFGHKMGMTNDGEFVHEVPGKYFLFMQYAMNTPMVHGGQKAWPTMGGTFRVMAKVVDQVELDRLVSMAELALAEDYMDAEAQQGKAKACAPREPMHDVTSDEKKKGNKAAVGVSEKGLKEGRMPASVIKHKQKLAGMTPEEKKKHFSGKSEEELKSMARRHGYGKDSDEYSKHVKEEQIDEKAPPGAKFERMVKHIKKGYSKDGLTAKEKGIAYATAWKAKKRESKD